MEDPLSETTFTVKKSKKSLSKNATAKLGIIIKNGEVQEKRNANT
jgi:hypothetical protein